jgi:heme exporter protein A
VTPAAAAAQPEPPVIEIRELSKRYGPIAAVDEIDLDIRRGESVLLLGPNGAGKSTLLRMLSGLTRPTSGTLRVFGGSPAGSAGSTVRRRLGLLSHQTFLYDHLTAAENLEFCARLYGVEQPERVARAALREVDLEDRATELVQGFSRGMQQRLAIARSILHRPDLLLFDEPYTGLDRDAARRLSDSLLALRHEGRTCVMTTHDFSSGLAVTDRIVVLATGRKVIDRPSAGLDTDALDRLFHQATRRPLAVSPL